MRVSKYRKTYVVKSYEVDCHSFLRILSLMNALQEVAVEHADSFGLGLENCLTQNLAWVGSNYLIRISRLPRLHEKFTIETWPSVTKLWGAIRDFRVTDEAGKVIITAASQWVLIDIDRRRPVMLKKYFPDYEALEERVAEVQDIQFDEKMLPPERADRITDFMVRFDDIDINGHVNNCVYPLWASESTDSSFRLNHLPTEIELCYKKEALYGKTVTVSTQMAEDESRHLICDKKSGDELALCRIKWIKIENSAV